MKKYLLLLALAGLSACNPGYHLTKRTANRIGVDSLAASADASVANFLIPYREKLDKAMNEVLTSATKPIEKALPDGPLNDLLTDAVLQQASQRYGKPVDCSHLNYGVFGITCLRVISPSVLFLALCHLIISWLF
ncbi:hypothetical protein [Spirosoma telluris]|uniref:hypothetical protein n=1 Tax=Spirosoma telluris TaxID=2183553 RepID=UPI002FC2E09F